MRVEMRQIGARDEAKVAGGMGVCGRELCCSSWLREFQAVSVKMAKAQGLATAFVPRPTEHGPAQRTDLEPDRSCVDVSAPDFVALARALGC